MYSNKCVCLLSLNNVFNVFFLVSVIPLLLNSIPLYENSTIFLLLTRIWVVSSFWLLWLRLLWTFVYKTFCGHMFSFPLGEYLGMELLILSLTWGSPLEFLLPHAAWTGNNHVNMSLSPCVVPFFYELNPFSFYLLLVILKCLQITVFKYFV